MTKENVLFAAVGLLLGVVVTSIATTHYENRHHYEMMRTMNDEGMMSGTMGKNMMQENNGMNSAMSGMVQGLSGKSGDEFDKAFLSGMIIHHQGAIDMANSALTDASHQEVKDLAKNIINAQTKEIAQMKDWELKWYNLK